MSFKRTILLKLICCFAVAAVLEVSGQQDVRVTLYEQFGNTGMSVSTSGYIPNLSHLGFDKRARSACVVGMSYTDTPYCFDFTELVAADISSVRFVGSTAGLHIQTFTLYQYATYTGMEEYITNEKDTLYLADEHRSIILTGGGNWTVFEDTNFTGPRACLVSTGTGLVLINDITTVGLRYNSLRSVRKGCETNPKTVVYLQSSMNVNDNSSLLNLIISKK
ncbi:unnamed protein product [Orchesella dallaii]|uniref:Uncharacterized protein n=1 Tax=Orchesella dallaii TaxID=48710 RepID=A0ABP1RK53_9HEXA